jgi:hypothetical protein
MEDGNGNGPPKKKAFRPNERKKSLESEKGIF